MVLFDEKCSNKNSLHPKMIIEEHNLVEIGEDTKSLKVTNVIYPLLDNFLLKRIIVNCPSCGELVHQFQQNKLLACLYTYAQYELYMENIDFQISFFFSCASIFCYRYILFCKNIKVMKNLRHILK